jgi:hypothetical protein
MQVDLQAVDLNWKRFVRALLFCGLVVVCLLAYALIGRQQGHLSPENADIIRNGPFFLMFHAGLYVVGRAIRGLINSIANR